MVPEASPERWTIASGALVRLGQTLAQIRIEDALHNVIAPVAGWLTRSLVNHILEPAALLGHVTSLSAVGE